MAIIALLHEHFDTDHLDAVADAMKQLGSPTVRAVDLGDGLYAALEGCHRLRAAEAIGVAVELDLVEYDDTLMASVCADWHGDADCTVADVCDAVGHTSAIVMVDLVAWHDTTEARP